MSSTAFETFKERTYTSIGKEGKVTKDGILKSVHLVGLIGKANKAPGKTEPYKYRESAIKKAVDNKVYDDVNSFLGHSDDAGNRNPKDRIGFVVTGTTIHKEGIGAVGDIQLNPEHPHYKSIVWWANNHPEKIMLSQESILVYNKTDNMIDEIRKVESVDFVVDGNTTESLFREGVIADKIGI